MNGHPIQGGSIISGVLNVTVGDSTWTTVKTTQSCKALLCKLRTGSAWKLRRVGESTYITIDDALSLDLALMEGENLGQVQTASGADTLEVLLLD
jgi:hypothetical protein